MTTAEHEGAHVVACLLLKLPVIMIDTVGDGVHYAGLTTHGTDKSTFEGAFKYALVLAAPAALGGGRRAFTWPIDLLHDGDFSKDLLDLARLFAMKGWNRGVWEELVEGALKFVTSDRFTSMFSSVTGVLDHYPQLDARLLEALERSLL